jgi:predicted metal-dependent phosphotriesterase family hydrolase
MTFVRAIRGDIDPARMDTTHAGDHLIRIGGGATGDPQDLLGSAEKAVEEAGRLPAADGNTIVGPWPANCGRGLAAAP